MFKGKNAGDRHATVAIVLALATLGDATPYTQKWQKGIWEGDQGIR
jgi:hypothetical protein